MKQTSQNNENESREASWPNVLRIASDEFQQGLAVADLAVKLCKLRLAQLSIPLEKQNLDPQNYLAEAWKLIEAAHKHVIRPQGDVEYMVQHEGTKEALAQVLYRRDALSRIPFQELCNPMPKNDQIEINGIQWVVYRSERGFTDLFWDYWRDIGEKWNRGDQKIGTVQEVDTKGNQRTLNFYSDKERKRMRFRARLKRGRRGWPRRGKDLLNYWKQNGLPPADFSALAEFRKARDNRIANLQKKQKPKTRRGSVER